jgi:hypothetical protein
MSPLVELLPLLLTIRLYVVVPPAMTAATLFDLLNPRLGSASVYVAVESGEG